MKMRNRNEAPAAILANVEVFDYLKEKVGERKTRTEAYCDLLDKSLAGFVSPFLRRQDYDLSPCQCHVTVSDLASEWHWHRATVRSFLDTLEALGQLERIRLAKSVVITMPLRTGTPAMPDSGREEADFATRIQEALYDWIIGKATSFDVGKSCGQIMRQTLTEIAGRDSRIYPDRHSDTASAQTVRSEEQLCEDRFRYPVSFLHSSTRCRDSASNSCCLSNRVRRATYTSHPMMGWMPSALQAR